MANVDPIKWEKSLKNGVLEALSRAVYTVSSTFIRSCLQP